MHVKQIIFEDFVNYKKPSMFIGFSKCSFKCDKEFGSCICQNSSLANSPSIEISEKEIAERYISNSITSSIVCGGLEPFDTFEELINLITEIRNLTDDDIVIYTGYKYEEIKDKINILKKFNNIIIKFGRYIPNSSKRYDDVLGVYLSSENQYALRLN